MTNLQIDREFAQRILPRLSRITMTKLHDYTYYQVFMSINSGRKENFQKSINIILTVDEDCNCSAREHASKRILKN